MRGYLFFDVRVLLLFCEGETEVFLIHLPHQQVLLAFVLSEAGGGERGGVERACHCLHVGTVREEKVQKLKAIILLLDSFSLDLDLFLGVHVQNEAFPVFSQLHLPLLPVLHLVQSLGDDALEQPGAEADEQLVSDSFCPASKSKRSIAQDNCGLSACKQLLFLPQGKLSQRVERVLCLEENPLQDLVGVFGLALQEPEIVLFQYLHQVNASHL
jgi:hypothetical protein